jgi:hypothetical protein
VRSPFRLYIVLGSYDYISFTSGNERVGGPTCRLSLVHFESAGMPGFRMGRTRRYIVQTGIS